MSIHEAMTALADIVRMKSGKTEEMTIEEMTDALARITVSGERGFTCGSFVAEKYSTAVEIEHGLGHVPGAILFVKKHSTDSSMPSSTATSVSDALMSIVFGPDAGIIYVHHYYRKPASSGGSSTSTSQRTWSYNAAVPEAVFGTGSAAAYYMTNINKTTFTTPRYLIANRQYFWIAFKEPLM